MPPLDQSRAVTEPGTAPAAVVAAVVSELAGVLNLDPGRIDPAQSFRALGVGSVPAVRFVSLVNRRFGTALTATALAGHPTPLALAALVAREAGDSGAEAGAVADEAAVREILGVLRERLAGLLGCEPDAIDPATPFELLGVDSIRAAKFAAAVNDAYGMDERVVSPCEHPNLAAMAAHVANLPAAGPPPAAGPEAAEEVGALLDAVREDRISVDEALTRLPHRL
ncbi:acyl carrier protein [Streptomyces zhihengii]|uniref:acyl carrier protein n=1 Tax=Streptomyces zhihengii TaxID=1818004 RepID=UPI0036331E4D